MLFALFCFLTFTVQTYTSRELNLAFPYSFVSFNLYQSLISLLKLLNSIPNKSRQGVYGLGVLKGKKECIQNALTNLLSSLS